MSLTQDAGIDFQVVDFLWILSISLPFTAATGGGDMFTLLVKLSFDVKSSVCLMFLRQANAMQHGFNPNGRTTCREYIDYTCGLRPLLNGSTEFYFVIIFLSFPWPREMNTCPSNWSISY